MQEIIKIKSQTQLHSYLLAEVIYEKQKAEIEEDNQIIDL